ncbi:MAG: hypothetical protein V1792_13985 [Pseudomonadota bacterium]
MRIRIESNFFILGFDGKELEASEGTTLRQMLSKLAGFAEERIEFFRRGSDELDTDDWEINVNGMPYHKCRAQLETLLAAGDLLEVRMNMMGGG